MILLTKMQKIIFVILFILFGSSMQASFFGDMKASYHVQKGDEYYDSKQYIKAFNKYEEAAKADSAYAYFQLFVMYKNGEGVQKDKYKASSMLLKSSSLKYPMAEVILANRLLYGKKKDVKGAIRLLEDAAKQENSIAYVDLYHIYKYGLGVKKDIAKANGYYRLAKVNGFNIRRTLSKKASNNRVLTNKNLIANIQRGLKKLGFYKSKVDGISGPMTRKAITNFQKHYGYSVDSQISTKILEQINSK